MKARDIMTTDVVSVQRDTSVHDAAALLAHHRITSMPVVDEDDRVIGMVSEIVPAAQLLARTREIAAIIASQPKLAIEGTVRAIWSTREMPQREAVRLGYAFVAMGTNQDSIAEGQQMFASGKRVEWKLR